MAKKRPLEESDKSETQAKKIKEAETEFNGTVFKSTLKDPTKAMKALEKFVSVAKKLPCANLYDVVEGYIKISMECAELFKLLEEEKRTESELTLIFQSLEVILLRTASDLSHFSMVGTTIVKKIVTNHMKLLQTSLHSEDHRVVRQCLGLLSSMVSQGPEMAREVFSHFYFSKGLSGLARRRDKKGRPDVRMAYIQFALSFLISGDASTIGQVLEMKDFLTDILSTGLKEDRMSVVNLILSTLQTKVVWNKGVSKTQKVRFFVPVVLAQIASLYKWDGVVDVSSDGTKAIGDPEEDGRAVVRELVHHFLLDLCCSRKHGISFHDPSFGTAGRVGNVVLLQFLVGLKQATEDKLVADLVVNVLKGNPDMLPRYFKETQYSFTPRIRSAWQENIVLLKKIYEAQPEVSRAFQTREVVPLPRLVAMVMVTSLPHICNKAFFTQALNMPNVVVKHTALSLVSFILRRAEKNVEHCLDRSIWERSGVYTPTAMEEFVQQYREALSKVLPDINGIISNWQSLTKKGKGDDEKMKKGGGNEEEEGGPNDPDAVGLKALILRVLCLYQKVVPHVVSQSSFDFGKLLKGVMLERGVNEQVPPVLQYLILQLALDLPASKFSWFQVQDMAEVAETGGEKSVFYLLLQMLINSKSVHLRSSTRMLILKVLRDSGIFEYTWKELEVWLDHLERLQPAQQEAVSQFLQSVLVRLVAQPYIYTDMATSVVQDTAYLQANLGGHEADATSLPVSHIDDALDMMDVVLEAGEGDADQLGPSLCDDLIVQTFPFSALVPAVLEARNSLPAAERLEKGVLFEYLATVFHDVLHSQRDPVPLCLALQQYDKELDSAEDSGTPHPAVVEFYHYYSQWIPTQAKEELFKSSEARCPAETKPDSAFREVMKVAYCRGPASCLWEVFTERLGGSLSALRLPEFPAAVKQVLLYLRTSVDKFSVCPNEAALTALLSTLGALLHKLQSVEEAPGPRTADLQGDLDLVLEMDPAPGLNENKEQVLLSVLDAIFTHPTLQSWFLALELGATPVHSLSPVRLKALCGRLDEGTLALLQSAAPALRERGLLALISGYLRAVQRAVLKELSQKAWAGRARKSFALSGLLALRGYMDASELKEVVSALLLLPKERLVIGTKGGGAELSAYGQATVQVLLEAAGDHAPLLSRAHLRGLGSLLASCPDGTAEDLLQVVLREKPSAAALLPPDVLLHCLRAGGPTAAAVGPLMLRNCDAHLLRFELWCLEPSTLERVAGSPDDFLPLLSAYLTAVSSGERARPHGVQKAVLNVLKEELLPILVGAVLSSEACASLPARVEALSSLIKLAAKGEDLVELTRGLPGVLGGADSSVRWQLVNAISEKLESSPNQLASWRKELLSAALRWLNTSFKHGKEREGQEGDEELAMLPRVQSLLAAAEKVSAPEWNSFLKAGLKYRYRNAAFLDTLNGALTHMYSAPDAPADLVTLSTVHAMVTSHSLFLPSMLDVQGESGETVKAKEALVSLLLTLVQKCPAVCHSGHFVVLLGAYGATLSHTDQKLLLLLQEYERNDVSLAETQFLLWGRAAVEHHKARKSLGLSLWQQPSGEDLLALLSPDRMLNTIASFPQHRRIIPQEARELLYKDEAVSDLGALYDPCFLLPLFSMLLKPESVVDCHRFVSSHALGVTAAALSSYDPKVRAAAYQVLGSFYHHLEAARIVEKRQLLYLMDSVRNGIRQENLRVAPVLTMYVSRVAQLMLKPEEHMYLTVNRFLLAHQYLDLRRVPAFFKLFYSSDMEHKMEREWILSVLHDGLTDRQSYELCDQQGIFQVLLGFCSSPLCDEPTQVLILDVLQRAAHLTKAAYELIKVHGLLTWILHIAERRYIEGRLLCSTLDLVHRLWFTNLGRKDAPTTESNPMQSPKCLPLPLIGEFLCVLSAFTRHLHSGVNDPQLTRFLQALDSVLRHRDRAQAAWDATGRIALPEEPVPCTTALALLHCWGSRTRDAPLMSALQGVLERHKVKELMGMVKERGRGTPHQQRVHAHEDGEGLGETVDGPACEHLLGSIFTHVVPASPSSSPPASQAADLAAETVQLLLRWMLRSLAAAPADSTPVQALAFLHWLHASVLPRQAVLRALLADAAVTRDLLRLYHRSCQHPVPGPTLHLFTDVMLRLLEARRGPGGGLHHTVVRTCMSVTDDDSSQREAGLLLLSLFVRELWNDSDEPPQLFLSHIRLVADLRHQGLNKHSVSQRAVTRLCQALSAALDPGP